MRDAHGDNVGRLAHIRRFDDCLDEGSEWVVMDGARGHIGGIDRVGEGGRGVDAVEDVADLWSVSFDVFLGEVAFGSAVSFAEVEGGGGG